MKMKRVIALLLCFTMMMGMMPTGLAEECTHEAHTQDGLCTVCSTAVEHSYADGACTVCGLAEPTCEHEWNGDAFCDTCGAECGHEAHGTDGACAACGTAVEHSYADGVCTVCGQSETPCEEHAWNGDAFCDNCGAECAHNYNAGVCEVCGLAEPTCDHAWNGDVFCDNCGAECGHVEHDTDGVCADCYTTVEHSYTDGICTVCGLACPAHDTSSGACPTCGAACLHENVETNYPHEPAECTEIDAVYHKVIGDICMRVKCTDCGTLTYEEVVEANAERYYTHNVSDEDPSACECGYVFGCAHENGFTDGACNDCSAVCEHRMGYTDDICEVCGQSVPSCEEHDWNRNNGVCNACGATCGHEVTHTWYDVRGTWVPAGTRKHTLTGPEWEIVECDVCMYWLVEEQTGRDDTRESDHLFYEQLEDGNWGEWDGYCEECNYYSSCEHPNAFGWADVATDWISDNNLTHSKTGEIINVTHCDDCTWHAEEATGVQDTITNNHNYYTYDHETGETTYVDVCQDCGHTNNCEHPNRNEWTEVRGDTYEFVSNREHKRVGKVWLIYDCLDCGVHFEEETEETGEQTEDHYYYSRNEDTGEDYYDDYCEACQNTNTCGHENASTWTDVATDWVSDNDRTHSKTGEIINVTHCDDCTWHAEEATGVQDTITNNHNYYTYDHETGETAYVGVCQDCRHENNCTHDNRANEWTEVRGDTYEFVNNRHHKRVGKVWLIYDCIDCDVHFEEETEEPGEQTEDHYYYSRNEETGEDYYEGYCEACDYWNSCGHDNANRWTWVDGQYTSVDDAWCTATGEVIDSMYCEDCNYGENIRTGETETRTELHNYYRYNDQTGHNDYVGECDRCGHKNECEHTGEVVTDDQIEQNHTFSPIDGINHTVTYDRYTSKVCQTCQAEFSYKLTEEGATKEEQHYYYQRKDEWGCYVYTGVCGACGDYENPCPHSGDVRFDDRCLEDTRYIGVNDEIHVVSGRRFETWNCPDCGFEINRNLTDDRYIDIEDHQYYQWDEEKGFHVFTGVCGGCGHEHGCPHDDVSVNENWIANGVYVPKGDREHEVTGDRYVVTTCNNCGHDVSYELAEPGAVIIENHHYYRWSEEEGAHVYTGYCEPCDYHNPCGHEDAEVYEWININCEGGGIESLDDAKHSATGEVWEHVSCEACGADFDRKTDRFETRTDYHNYYYYDEEFGMDFYDGWCKACGHENKCGHEDAEFWYEAHGVTGCWELDDKQHWVRGQIIDRFFCEACGVDAYMRGAENGEIPEDHNFFEWDEALEYDVYTGVCSGCGYVYPCQHENADTWEEIHGDTFVDLGDAGHSQTGRLFNHLKCPDCGTEWLEYVGENETREYPHEYYLYDGERDTDTMLDYCYWCEHECPCDHSEEALEYRSEVDVREDAQWTPTEDGRCSATGERIDCWYCEGCDTEYRVRSGEEETVKEGHDYYDHDEEYDLPVYNGGECKRCGYVNECGHENMSSWEEIWHVESCEQLDGEQHVTVGLLVGRAWCQDCDSDWWDVIAEHYEQTEEHYFFETVEEYNFEVYTGVCSGCGYEHPCSHENSERVGFWCVEGEITARDELTHSWTGKVYDWYKCADCGMMWNQYAGDSETRKTSHIFWEYIEADDTDVMLDACYECKYERTCEHENAERWYEVDGEKFEKKNDSVHERVGERIDWIECPDCDNTFKIRYGEEGRVEEAHNFWGWSEEEQRDVYTGVCDACGQKNECEHLNAEEREDIEGERRELEGDDLYHWAAGTITRVVYCPDCDQNLEVEETGVIDARKERHNYCEWDDELEYHVYTGECADCGHENSCGHENKDEEFQVHGDQFVDNGDGTHTLTGRGFDWYYCPDCDNEWLEYVGEDMTQTDKHFYIEYDEENDTDIIHDACVHCGAALTCEHKNAETGYGIDGPATFIDIHTHEITGERIDRLNCPDCGMIYDIRSGDTVTDKQEHWFWHWDEELQRDVYDGYCEGCDYVNECEHPNAEYWEEVDGECTQYEGDNFYHSVTGVLYQCGYCRDCGVGFLREPGETVTRDERHNYHTWNEELGIDEYVGTCQSCRYKNTCGHEEVYDVVGAYNGTYEKIDHLTHRVTGLIVNKEWCAGCDTDIRIEVAEANGTRELDHWYMDGENVCADCGFTCEHEETRYIQWIPDEQVWYERQDAEVHRVCGPLYDVRMCVSCGQWTEEELAEESGYWTEPHNMADGVCIVCGFTDPEICEHNSWCITSYQRDTEEFVNITLHSHARVYEQVEYTECELCHTRGEEVVKNVILRVEPHEILEGMEWAGGECGWCGYKNQCPHENTHDVYEQNWSVKQEGGYTFANFTPGTHDVTGKLYKETICDDCGIVVAWEENVVATATVAHSWDEEGYACRYCGYVATCQHPNRTSYDEAASHEFDGDGQANVYYDRITAAGHVRHARLAWHEVCPDCGLDRWSFEYDTMTAAFERHVMKNGMCIYCSYTETACAHENFTADDVYLKWVGEEGKYEPAGEKQHCYTANLVEAGYCADCLGYVEVIVREEVMVYEEHDLNNGECERCGYTVENCGHTNLQVSEELDATGWGEIDELTHNANGTLYRYEYCPDCGWHSEQIIGTDVTQVHPHEMDGARCTLCGYHSEELSACTHPATTRTTGRIVEHVLDLKWNEHTVGAYVWFMDRCSDCGKVMEEGGEFKYITEAHTVGEDNNCTVCGYSVWVLTVTELSKTGTVNADGRELWGSPSTGGCYEQPVAKGEKLSLIAELTTTEDMTWYAVQYGENVYYIEKEYVDLYVPAQTGWVLENGQWCWIDQNGNKLTNVWMEDGKGWLYLGADGYAVKSQWIEDYKGWCYVDANGYMVTNSWQQDSIGWCYLGADGSMMKNAWVLTDGKWYYVNADGYRALNCWAQDSKGWVYLGADGAMVTNSWQQKDGKWCYVGESGYMVTYTWQKDSAGWCYLGADGFMMTNAWVLTDGKWYCVDANGYRVINEWRQDSRGWVYLGADGAMVTNAWAKDSKGWCYVGADGYIVANVWIHDGTAWRYAGADGYAITNTWKQGGSGLRYMGADGYSVSNTWVHDGKGWRYLGADGCMMSDSWIHDGKAWRYAGSDGYAITNTWKQGSSGLRYMGADGYSVSSTWIHDGKGWRYLGSDGYMVVNSWKQASDTWRYLGADGYAVTNSWKQDATGWCYLNSEGSMTKNAWVTTDGKTYRLDAQGHRVISAYVQVDGKKYWMGSDGAMVKNAWHQDTTGWVYLGTDGAMMTNAWHQDSKGWRYVGSDGYAITNTWKQGSKGWRYMGADGYSVVETWVQDSKGWRYLGADGYMVVNSWKQASDTWRYLGADGYAMTNSWKQDATGWCYLNSEGSMTKNAWVTTDGKTYRLDTQGHRVISAYVQVDGKKYWMGSDGAMVKNAWHQDTTGWVYLGTDGAMTTNAWVTTDGKTYRVNAQGYRVISAFVEVDGKKYWMGSDGAMVKNAWQKDSKGWVYLGADGVMLTNAWKQDSKGWRYLGADGYAVVNSWKQDTAGWRYLGADGYAVTNCWKQDTAGWRYLDGTGSVVKNAWVTTDGKTYRLNDQAYRVISAWVQVDGKWYWMNSDGAMVKNSWMKDSRGWVYLGADGAMKTNAWVQDSKGWCYLGADGYAVTNCWKQDSVGWCYLDSEGSMVKNAWVTTDGKTYRLNAQGYRVTSAWVLVDGKWYWLNSDGTLAKNQWKADSVGWVYVGADGAMVTNAWTKDSVGWCYMGSDGYAVTNTWKHDGTGWRYLGSNGSMLKNQWLQDGGSWYYLNGDGYMVTGTVTIDGTVYQFDANGVWLG